jgi:hypothetical protein
MRAGPPSQRHPPHTCNWHTHARRQFNLSDEQATRFLSQSGWNSNTAANAFFESGEEPKGKPAGATGGGFNAAKAEAEFARLAGADAATMGTEPVLVLMGLLGYSDGCVLRPAAIAVCARSTTADDTPPPPPHPPPRALLAPSATLSSTTR